MINSRPDMHLKSQQYTEPARHTAAAGTVELMSGSWMGLSNIDSSFNGTNTFLLLKSCGQKCENIYI